MSTTELPSLRHLRMFEAVARLESVSRAAMKVNRSQPAVTQALAKLERVLGVELIERRHSGSYLTDFGRILLLRTQRLFGTIERALAEPLAGAALIDNARLRAVASRLSSSQLQCLILMAERGTGSARVDGAGVTPRTVLRSVRQLEGIIDRRITRSGPQGTSLTPVGLELSRRASLASKEFDYAREEIAAVLGTAHATISVGAVPQCTTLVLTAAIEKLLRHAPSANIRVAQGPYDFLLGDLRAGKIDLLFGVLRKPDWAEDVDEEPLFEAPYAIVTRRGHPLTSRQPLSRKDLAAYDWILPQPGTPRRLAFERLFKGARVQPRSSIETAKPDLQAALIETSNRITMMAAQEARRLEEKGALAVLDYRLPAVGRFEGIATRAGWHPTPTSRRFLEILREIARSAGGLPRRTGKRAHSGR